MDGWRAMSKWANDSIPVAGAAYRQWVEDFHRGNRLARGKMRLRGRRVDLSAITVPLLNIAGRKDHLCLLPQAEATMDLVSSPDRTLVVLDAGHVGLLVGRGARNGLWPQTSAWLAARSSDQAPESPHRNRRTPS
jgi:polyhydroxyalkanoate synthase